LCGGWKGTLGNEPSLDLYVQNIVAVFREVWRVLHDSGSVFANLGDSYSSSSTHGGENKIGPMDSKATMKGAKGDGERGYDGLKPKDLCMIPARCALALQADGWFLRSEIVWTKGLSYCPSWAGSVMPGSQQDRPTSAHEMIYLLSKRPHYFYDQTAVRDGAVEPDRQRNDRIAGANGHEVRHSPGGMITASGTRTLRDVWAVSPSPMPAAHFASFPPKIVEPCVLAGSSAYGCCPDCGAPWQRVVLNSPMEVAAGPSREDREEAGEKCSCNGTMTKPPETTTLGWQPTCKCYLQVKLEPKPPKFTGTADEKREARKQWQETIWLPWWHRVWPILQTYAKQPCTVLDPFIGSGTTALVARDLGRHAVGIDASADYLTTIAIPRLQQLDPQAPLPATRPTARPKKQDPRQGTLFD